MKTNLFRTSSILAVLVLLVAVSLSSTAQESIKQQQRPVQQEAQQQEPQLPVQQLDAEALRIAIPRACQGIRPDVQTHGDTDNFNPPGTPVTLSPALASFVVGKALKGYDDPAVNKFFADSFKLRNCRVCYATLEVRVRHYGDAWTNDGMAVGVAPFDTSPGIRLVSTGIWTPQTPNPKTLTFALPTAALNSYLSSTSTIPSFLDIPAQDDTDFDYMKLSVWYY
jgi:hypothetical protein